MSYFNSCDNFYPNVIVAMSLDLASLLKFLSRKYIL